MTSLNRQAISLLGGLVVVIILIAGMMLGVLPLFSDASDVREQVRQVESQNDQYRARIAELSAQQENLPQLQATAAERVAQIPESASMDGVIRVAAAAAGPGIVLTKIEPGAAEKFEPPTEPVDLEAALTGGRSGPGGGPPVEAGQPQQIPVTLEATAGSMADAVDFVNALRDGPRLLRIENVQIERVGPDADYGIIVVALAFVAD